jgi:hypothetical protein
MFTQPHRLEALLVRLRTRSQSLRRPASHSGRKRQTSDSEPALVAVAAVAKAVRAARLGPFQQQLHLLRRLLPLG